MKANMKKLLAMGLTVALAVGCLTGCGDEKSSSTSDSSSSSDSSEGSSTSKKTFDDLGGITVTVGDWYTTGEVGDSPYAKDTEAYRKEIMEKYNFEITRETKYAYADMQETYVNGVMSNSPSCHLFYLYQEMVSAPLMKGLMYDLSTLPEFDFKEEKWNQTVVELMSIGNGIWGRTSTRRSASPTHAGPPTASPRTRTRTRITAKTATSRSSTTAPSRTTSC